jgi:hypothetical protein
VALDAIEAGKGFEIPSELDEQLGVAREETSPRAASAIAGRLSS